MDMHYRMSPGAVLLWFQDSFARDLQREQPVP